MKLAAMRELNIGLLLLASAVVLELLVGAGAVQKQGHPHMREFVYMLLALLTAMLCKVASLWMEGDPRCRVPICLCTLTSIVCASLVCVLYVVCLVSFVREPRNQRGLAKLVRFLGVVHGSMCLFVVGTVSTGCVFSVDKNGIYHDGPLYFLLQWLYFLTNLAVPCLVIGFQKRLPVSGIWNLLSFSVFPMMAVAIAPYWYPTPVYIAAALSCLLLYNFFHGELLWQLTESRISITLSQLRPHFLYNVLNSIYHLCDLDPGMAQQAVDKFSDYLRSNMASLEQLRLVPFEREYGHIQAYLSLEQLRFSGLKVVYDMAVTDFLLPPLTVQPLVENAVKHGVTKKRGGGTVTISTRETEREYCVQIQDTGVGFDPDRYAQDGRVHIGIQNVRQRLSHMVGGTLTIVSEPGKGTRAVVAIPKKEAAKK